MTADDPSGMDFLRQRIQEQRELPAPEERKRLREACGVSVTDLAQSICVTGAAVRQWESGVRAPQGVRLRRYIEALRVLKEECPDGDEKG